MDMCLARTRLVTTVIKSKLYVHSCLNVSHINSLTLRKVKGKIKES